MDIKANPGDYVKIALARKEVEGTFLESHEKDVVLLKLNSGYNIGIPRENIQNVRVVRKYKSEKITSSVEKKDKSKKTIGMVVTGGTIASKLDPKTGGVSSLTSMEEFAKFYSKLFEKVNVKKIEVPFMADSSAMDSDKWKIIAENVKKLLDDKEVEGVIVTHGTDTLHYTASALSFFLKNLSKPVVLTYSQRSIDRASSDAELNLLCAAETAISDLAEVVIVGHSGVNDDFCSVVRGTKARKMHTSKRDAFKSVNAGVIAKVTQDKIEFLENRRPRNKEKVELDAEFNDKIALVKFYPGQDPAILDFYKLSGYKGIVLEVLGLGQIGDSNSKKNWLPTVKKLVKEGMIICATAQTIYGRLNPKVYSAGRELEDAGVIFLEDMLSETAFVKLGWVLGHRTWKGEKAKEKMLENVSFEFNEMLRE